MLLARVSMDSPGLNHLFILVIFLLIKIYILSVHGFMKSLRHEHRFCLYTKREWVGSHYDRVGE